MTQTVQLPADWFEGTSALEVAQDAAVVIEQEWQRGVTHGVTLFLADFDHVALTPAAATALAAARQHLEAAHSSIQALTAEFLAANTQGDHT